MIYGYARISSPRQNIERQIRNIKGAYPEAVVIQEVFTGTNYKDRKRLKGIDRREGRYSSGGGETVSSGSGERSDPDCV